MNQPEMPGGKQSLKLVGHDDQSISGYQKYLHMMGKVILDNTDQFEPLLPNFSNF